MDVLRIVREIRSTMGQTMLMGRLQSMGCNTPFTHAESFSCCVPGPNSLWHIGTLHMFKNTKTN